jgi:sulfur carrier protein
MISIQVNNTAIEVPNDSTIIDLLQFINSPLKGIAVAIDTNILPKENWKNTLVKNNDNFLIIQSTQGG